MNVVGRVSSIITQGVYSVATPFHPFGGAVDIIVVRQQDGSFRSTPWYVRFGKFQGVLKGAEKIVRIEVNGVEANFHMYLDNSGEAYFIKEVVPGQESELSGALKDSDSQDGIKGDGSVDHNNNEDSRKDTVDICRLESNISDTGEVQLQDENVFLGVNRLERMESDMNQRYYEFQDEQSSLEGSVELSEYGSSRYENLDSVEHVMETQDPNSEVVLVSVDGHILTAPILSSEENTENVQLSIPQFHLGPGEGAGEASWPADYMSDLDTSTAKVSSENVPNRSNNMTSEDRSEVCEGDGEKVSQVEETEGTSNEEPVLCMNSSPDSTHSNIKKDDVFQSCLQLTELAKQVGDAKQEDANTSPEVQKATGDILEKDPNSPVAPKKAKIRDIVELADSSVISPSGEGDELSLSNNDFPSGRSSPDSQVEAEHIKGKELGTEFKNSNYPPFHLVENGQKSEDQIDVAVVAEEIQSCQQQPPVENKCRKGEDFEIQTTPSDEDKKTDSSMGFELSLCGNFLHAGMGWNAAAEAFDAHRVPEDEFRRSAASIIKNENLVIKFRGRFLPWDKAAPVVLGMAAYGLNLPVEYDDVIPVDQEETPKSREDDANIVSTSGRRWRLWPIPFRRVKTLEHTSSNSSEEVFVDSEPGSLNQTLQHTPISEAGGQSPHKQLMRTNVPSTEQIASLNLKEGQNLVTFSFSTRVLGMQKVDAHIYLWKWNARIVISDVDGTITKSDVLGQFMPLVGRDWTHSGIARLFSAIKENGYQLLFLSARAIVQAYLTRSFLNNLKQDGKTLPNGPVVISPDGLFPSLYREVIRRAPHEFKIACLEDIKALFPSDYNPFYAGFGNRDTDELSYRKIGIPKGKIFIINPKGEVAINHRVDVKSYTSLHTLVNDMFPPTSMVEQEDYNSWNYWKMPLPDIDSF